MPYDTSITQEEAFGAESPCNIDKCPIEWSLYQYRPSLAANVTFVVLFTILGLVHLFQGIRWKSWGFMAGMLMGCAAEVTGYIGRALLYENPFAYVAFMVQIVCLTIAPVFFTASIYITLSKTIIFFAPELSRFKPQLFYWIFIPFDIVCLILQAAGGALSIMSDTESGSQLGIDISMAGLILQVIIIVIFLFAFGDYMIRYLRSGRASHFGWRLNAFFGGLAASIGFILMRCIYRVIELRGGYDGEMITHEIPFIILEGVVVVLAVVALCFGNPGLVFSKHERIVISSDSNSEKGVIRTSSPILS